MPVITFSHDDFDPPEHGLNEHVAGEIGARFAEILADMGHPVADEALFGPLPAFLAEVFERNTRLTRAS